MDLFHLAPYKVRTYEHGKEGAIFLHQLGDSWLLKNSLSVRYSPTSLTPLIHVFRDTL
jgi:hypothetical protein